MKFLAWFVSSSFIAHIERAVSAAFIGLISAGFVFGLLKGGLFGGMAGAVLAIPSLGLLPQDEGGVVFLDARPMALLIGAIAFYILSLRNFKQSQLKDTQSEE